MSEVSLLGRGVGCGIPSGNDVRIFAERGNAARWL